MARLTLGLDYGTNSVRGLVVDVATGEELATAVFEYPSGEAGLLLDENDPHLARQNPADYIKGFLSVCQQLSGAVNLQDVIGIGVDTTGSSPMPVDQNNVPLAANPDLKEDLASYVWLWKDHTSFAEAAEITQLAASQGLPYLAKCGGTYSSEWFWSKILHCARTAPNVFAAAHSWVEICDWIPAHLAGIQDPAGIKRSRCAAGHKAMFEEEWGGLPSAEFLEQLDPSVAALRSRLYDEVFTSDQIAGTLHECFATETGLPAGIPIAVGAFDAHFGAVASGAAPGTLVKIIGTSTCDCMVHPLATPLPDVPGMCGVVRGSILPGFYGLEAGQSAVGDIFNWVTRVTGQGHDSLNAAAAQLKPGESGLLALDWHNGNRTILVDPLLTGAIVGLNLHSTPAEMYRAHLEATAFGALRIIDRMEEYGVQVQKVIACGGIADKSPLTMQIYADVFNRPVSLAKSQQTCALGSAIFAAVVAGAYPDALEATRVMGGTKDVIYTPIPENVAVYRELYCLYRDIHDAFGIADARVDLYPVMKRLVEIQAATKE